jgi:hypothetical protein
MSKKHTLTKRHRRPKSGYRIDPTARTMAAVKELELAAKPETKSVRPKAASSRLAS